MKLRLHGDGASSKGKAKLKYKERSDGDDYGAVSSFDSSSDGGEDLLDAFENSRQRKASDLKILLETALSISDGDDGVPIKSRKESSCRKRGSQSSKKAQEVEGMRYSDADVQNLIGIHPGEIEFTGSIAEKSGRKNKGKKNKDRPILMWEVLEAENERWIEENLQIDMDLIDQNEIMMKTVEPSKDLIVPLFRYQKEWLAWALNQEESTARGGILADERGMGKTLQAIALILFKRSIATGNPEPHLPSSSTSSSTDLPHIKGTLVLIHGSGVEAMQWDREIKRCTSKGSTKVLSYHGPNRAKHRSQFSRYDFVITSYGIVEAEFRKYVMPLGDRCQYCGKTFRGNKLEIHLNNMCGPGAVRTATQAKEQRKEPMSKKMPDLEVHAWKINGDDGKSNDSSHKEMENDYSIESDEMMTVLWQNVSRFMREE